MPAVSLNQWSGALPTWSCFGKVFLDWLFLFCFLRRLFCRFNLLASTTSAVRTRASVGARSKLLSVGTGSKHGDLCNEQISDSNERFNLNRGGSVTTQAQGQTRAVAAKKVICGILAGRCKFWCFSFFWSWFSLFSWLVNWTASLSPVFQGWFARWINAINRWPNAVRLERPSVFWLVGF